MTNKQDINFFLTPHYKSFYVWCVALFFAIFFNSCNINKHLKEGDVLLVKNTVKQNGTFINHADLEAFIRQKPNRKILKLVRFNLWLYNQVDQKKMLEKKDHRNLKFDLINAKRIQKNTLKNERRHKKGKTIVQPKLKNKEKPTFRESILEVGEPPVILDSLLTRITKNQLQKYVFSKGYFNSTVRDSAVINLKTKRASLYYFITKSNPYHIQNISYKVEDPLIDYFIMNDTISS